MGKLGLGYTIGMDFPVKALFEISISVKGSSYLVIYGKHVNGYFCAIPNWEISCEMAEPGDTFFNASRLACVLKADVSREIANAIKDYAGRCNNE